MGGKAQALGRRPAELGEDPDNLWAQVGVGESAAQIGGLLGAVTVKPLERSEGALIRRGDDDPSTVGRGDLGARDARDDHIAVGDIEPFLGDPDEKAL
ncbi:Uncharacterised protein [Mycobacteroides abscessus subsp. massiliense]|nr:Uncharacterised protein [Mycobacteroides abscessus subsp. massiliense]